MAENNTMCEHKSQNWIDFVTESPLVGSYWVGICFKCKEPLFKYRGRIYNLEKFRSLIERCKK